MLVERTLLDQRLVERTLVDQRLVERTLVDQRLVERTLVDQRLVERTLADRRLVERTLVDQRCCSLPRVSLLSQQNISRTSCYANYHTTRFSRTLYFVKFQYRVWVRGFTKAHF